MKTKSAKNRLVTLVELDGVARKETRGVVATSVTDAMYWLRRGRAVTSAGDRGTITAWRDDAGVIRCHFCQFRQVVDSIETRWLNAAHTWLRGSWSKMNA